MKLVYNIWFDVAALFITAITILVLFTQYSNKSRANKLYRAFTLCLFTSEILDLITAITISYADSVAIWLNVILNSLFFLFNCLVLSIFSLYVFEAIKMETLKYFFVGINATILISEVLILIANIWTGISFSFTNGEYIHGPIFRLNYILPMIFLVEIIFLMVIYGRKMNRKLVFANIMMILAMIVALSIQNFLYSDVLLTMFAASLVALYTLFTLETPDYQELEYLRSNLENEVKKQTGIIKSQQDTMTKMSLEIITALAESIDAKDKYTRGHSKRVAEYSKILGMRAGLNEYDLRKLYYLAILHDIGKIGIPDSILKKPDKLTEEEFEIIKKHPKIGASILKNISLFDDGAYIIESHHERYDGEGYPNGLKGDDIPYFARIISIADSYDAMKSQRIYRKLLDDEYIRNEIARNNGVQFDPRLSSLFVELIDTHELDHIK